MGDMRHIVCYPCRELGIITVLDVLGRNSAQDDQYALERSLRGCEKHLVPDDFSNVS